MADAVLESPPAAPPVTPQTPTLRVSQMPAPTSPTPVKQGSAHDRMFQKLREKAVTPGATTPEPNSPPAPEPAQEIPPTPSPEESAPEQERPGEATPAPETPPGTPPATPPKGEKKSPWRLVDEWKGRATKAEQDILELKKSIVSEGDRKTIEERATKAEARAKELEDEIRFVNYSKSQEFQEKYQVPYEASWKRAMNELSEINIQDPATGTSRPVKADDILALVNMPLGQAREVANAAFGDFADDVMAHRKEIRGLYDVQAAALEEAKKTGSQREQEKQQQYKASLDKTQSFVKETWDKVNAEAASDPKYGQYFKPKEGNQEWNQRLAKGFELVDRAFTENPLDLALTPEQRSSVVRRHSAVRNRAAAFGALTHENETIRAENAELKKQLEQFKGSTPTTTPQAPNGSQTHAPASRWEGVRAGLQKLAR